MKKQIHQMIKTGCISKEIVFYKICKGSKGMVVPHVMRREYMNDTTKRIISKQRIKQYILGIIPAQLKFI